MWSYYGAKTNIIDLYPTPKHGRIVEPFAGSARYALEYFETPDILLNDKYDVIIKIWQWLQQCSPADIIKLPRPTHGDDISKMEQLTEVEKLFMGFIVGCGANIPRKKVGYRKTTDRPNHVNYNLKRIADNLFKIRHWKFSCSDYSELENKTATWFIDPPYEFGGEAYKWSNKKIDFTHLADWSRARKGQVIVCENTKAAWMDFKPMIRQRGSLYSTTEAIWSNEKTAYDNEQTKLFHE